MSLVVKFNLTPVLSILLASTSWSHLSYAIPYECEINFW